MLERKCSYSVFYNLRNITRLGLTVHGLGLTIFFRSRPHGMWPRPWPHFPLINNQAGDTTNPEKAT